MVTNKHTHCIASSNLSGGMPLIPPECSPPSLSQKKKKKHSEGGVNHLNNCSSHNSKDHNAHLPAPRGLNDKGANMDLFSQSSRYQSVTHGYTRLRFPVLRNTGGYHIGCIMCASAVAECMLPGSTFSSMHTCIRLQKTNTECPKTVVKKKKKKKRRVPWLLSPQG